MSSTQNDSELYLVGFRILSDSTNPQFYTLYVGCDRPIQLQDEPILFSQIELAKNALEICDCGAKELGSAPSDLYAVYDIALSLYLLCEADEQEGSELLDCINALLDITNATKETVPSTYRSLLHSFADHLTFNTNIDSYFTDNNIKRKEMLDAVYWCIGCITCNTIYL